MYSAGWVKIHRRMLDWQWFHDSKMVQLFIYLLLSANVEDRPWRNITLCRGQVVVTRKGLSERLGMSEQSVRTCLQKLQTASTITNKVTNKFTIVTICNFDNYQIVEGSYQPTNQPTNQPTKKDKEQEKEVFPSPRTPLPNQEKEQEKEINKNIYIPPPPPNLKIISLASSLSAAELAAEKQSWYDLFFWANCPCCSAQVTRFFRHNEKFGWKAKASDYVYDTKEARYALAQTWTQNEKFPRNRWKDSFLAVWRTLSIEAVNSSPETLKWLKSPKIALSLEGAYSDKSWTLRVPPQVARYIAGNERASLLLRDYFLAQSETQKYRIVPV